MKLAELVRHSPVYRRHIVDRESRDKSEVDKFSLVYNLVQNLEFVLFYKFDIYYYNYAE